MLNFVALALLQISSLAADPVADNTSAAATSVSVNVDHGSGGWIGIDADHGSGGWIGIDADHGSGGWIGIDADHGSGGWIGR